ncbi:MAG TPA: preprotein translocase subunit SecA, partial [Vicinamibacterales bacterium]|nr:preprotein translocase subunit SecA [Vicinamibacterales bacterium]
MLVNTILAKVIGTQNERDLKKLRPIVAEINALEADVQKLTDVQLRERTAEFRIRLSNGETLDDLLPEAFAVVREAGRRVLNMRHFDVQLIGGVVLHRGKIAEMKTGEGKTLVATLPAYLNALAGQGVHVVTVNDYLARRDSEWMGRLYRFLGLSVGVIQHELNDQERQVAYGADITYGTNNEFGFDYLRDNMKFELAHYVQRGHHFAIVDEVDSILIDEARTPLIISGPAEESTDLYYEVDRIIPSLKAGRIVQGNVKAEDREELEKTGDYIIDEKHKTVTLTESGMAKAERLLAHRLVPDSGGLYDPVNMPLLHHVQQGLRAHTLFRLDVDYMIKDGQVVIVDEFTGRLMPGRRWSDGLHQAVEAKEKVKIERENQTLATVTFQNYFRKYAKLSGMTGTADTEAEEFNKIYKLDVMVIPTNRVLRRLEEPDTVYRTEKEKYDAIVNDIIEKQQSGRPVLVGTVSIAKSERLSHLLKLRGIKHVVLNAKFHAQEAEIVAQAGRKGTVTIATNMAGRGTDILLGGNPEFMARQQTLGDELAEQLPKSQAKFVDDEEFVYFYHLDNYYRVRREDYERIYEAYKQQTDAEHDEVVALGGLHIIATERHEARRIDNQLRGRAGRQGDPGSSRFYLSLEDDLMRIFGSDRISGLMQKLGMEEGVPIEHGMVTRAIERAQKQVEAQNFAVRKHLLEYDDVMNKQRETIYALRRELLEGKIRFEGEDGEEPEVVDTRAYIVDLAEAILVSTLDRYAGDGVDPEERDYAALKNAVAEIYGFDPPELDAIDLEGMNTSAMADVLWPPIIAKYETKEKLVPVEILRKVERDIMLQLVDAQWKDHLYSLDHLKEGIGLRGYGQRDPLVEYKKESYALFLAMKDRVDEEIVRYLWRLTPVLGEGGQAASPVRQPAQRRPPQITLSGPATTPPPSPFGA